MKNEKQTVGLIGLGNAGMALAQSLVGTFEVVGYDRDQARREVAEVTGVYFASSAKQVSERCQIIILSLPTPAASVAAAAELALGSLTGRLVIESSTVGPHDIDQLQEAVSRHGGTVMDAAIVGGVHKLAAGKTTFLVGASQADFERARPILDCAAEEIFHLGIAGTGMRAKLVNNAVAHTTMVMLLEGAALAVKAGVPLEIFYKLMSRESGLTRPLTHRLGERIREQNFEGGMPTANARKDSTLALELAAELGVPMFTMQASHTVYEIACAQQLERLDYSSISKLFEEWSHVSMRFDSTGEDKHGA